MGDNDSVVFRIYFRFNLWCTSLMCVQESLTTLIKYFVDTLYAAVESVTYVQTFSKLKHQRQELQQKQERRLHDSSHRCSMPLYTSFIANRKPPNHAISRSKNPKFCTALHSYLADDRQLVVALVERFTFGRYLLTVSAYI